MRKRAERVHVRSNSFWSENSNRVEQFYELRSSHENYWKTINTTPIGKMMLLKFKLELLCFIFLLVTAALKVGLSFEKQIITVCLALTVASLSGAKLSQNSQGKPMLSEILGI